MGEPAHPHPAHGSRRFDARGLPLLDLANIRQPLNLVYTSRAFQPAAERLRPVLPVRRPEHRARPADPSFPADRLRDPVLFASLGTVFNADPRLLRSLATALAPLGGTVIVSTGRPIRRRWVRCRTTCSPAAPCRNPRCWPAPRCSSPTAG